MEYWGVRLRLARSSGIDFAFPAGFLPLPAATFRAPNVEGQHRARPVMVCAVPRGCMHIFLVRNTGMRVLHEWAALGERLLSW